MTESPANVEPERRPDASSSFSRVAGIAAATALGLRLSVAILFPLEPVSDAADYDAIARGLARGEGFAGAFRPPLYPLFVSLIYHFFGENVRNVYIAQAFVDTATCLLVAFWARRRLGDPAALGALCLGTVSMSAVASVRVLLSENLAAFLVVATVVAFDEALRRGTVPMMAVAGALAGTLTLTRGIMLLLPVGLAVVLLSHSSKLRPKLTLAAAFLTASVLTLVPWMGRNQRAVGSPVLTTQVGITFYSSHFLEEGQPYGVLTEDAVTREAAARTPVEASRYLVNQTLAGLARDPLRVVTAYPVKLMYLLIPIDYEVMGRRQVNITYLLVVALVALGIPAAYRKDPFLVVLALAPLVYLCVMALPFYGSPRFRLPAEPLLLPVAAFGWQRVTEAVRFGVGKRASA